MSGEREQAVRARGKDDGSADRAALSKSSGMRIGLFLKASVFDFIVVLTASAALAFTVSYGFNSAPDLRGNVAYIAAVQAVLLAVLYMGAWSKRMARVSAVAYLALLAAAVAVTSSLSPDPQPLFVDAQVNDVAGNYAVFGMVVAVVPCLVYLLSRRTWGVAALFAVGVIACGTIQFLYRDWISSQPGTVAALVSYVSIGALFVMQGYRQGVLKSQVVKRTSFGMAFGFGVLGSLACAGIAVLAFFAVISGLGLATVNVKPFEDYFTRPVVYYDGTFRQQQIYDPNVGTSNLSDEVDDTSDDENGAEREKDAESGGGFSFVSALQDTLDLDDWQESFQSTFSQIPLPLRVLLYLIPILLLWLVVWLRYAQRSRRLRRIEQHPLPERVALLYNFFLSRFERLGIDKPLAATPVEFALSSASELSGFTRNDSKADFLGVTLIYQRAVFGAGNVSESDYRYVADYYRAFFKNAHERMGNPRWVLKEFWRI